MSYIAIDVGGSHALCALMHEGGIAASERMTVEDNSSLAALLPELERCVSKLMSSNRSFRSGGVLISFCGLVDSASRRVVTSNGKYTDAPELDLSSWCERAFGLELCLENDARAALLGEVAAGAAKGFENVVLVTLGTGVGGAAMIDGRLLRGKHSQAGCLLGHFGANYRGRSCSCGNRGCVEAEASTWAVEQICREHANFPTSRLAASRRITFRELCAAADAGDACAGEVRAHCIEIWAAAAVTWIHAYDPEVIVFGGGVMDGICAFLPAIERYIHARAWTPWGKVAVRKAALGNNAPLYAGMAVFANENEKHVR